MEGERRKRSLRGREPSNPRKRLPDSASHMHIHVQSADGEAKFWVEPMIELARNHGLSDQDLRRVEQVIEEREQEIRDAWTSHFGS